MDRQQLLKFLTTEDPTVLDFLWLSADAVRKQNVGDEVHLRGLCEISSVCARHCLYCGLRADRQISRARMSPKEILRVAHRAEELGYGSIVLQAGEDPAFDRGQVARLVNQIHFETDLAITLSLGEQDDRTLQSWRDAGADRYLLRFETSNQELYQKIHPRSERYRNRIEQIWSMHEMGYQVGSGMMVGIPGQTLEDLVEDLVALRELPIRMIGLGPYLPHPDTPLGQHPELFVRDEARQVVATPLMIWKTIALARLQVPKANIPATTALAVLDEEQGRRLALQRGANVVMPNLTPPIYRELYEIYPSKARAEVAEEEDAIESFDHKLKKMIEEMGRKVGAGRGDALWLWQPE